MEEAGECHGSPTGPKETKSTVLSVEDEAIIVAFRRHTLLPLDDCLYALQPTIPHLTRSALHRCLQRHGINRLPDAEGSKPSKKKFKAYPIGYFHIDIAEVQTAEGKLYLYVAIDRTSKFAFVQLVKKTGRTSASAFLEALVEAVPYKIHTVLTDNGIQFTFPPRYADGPTARYATHMFDLRCRANGIEHRLTKIKHPWTNGQVERMNRTIKEATVQRYHDDRHGQLEAHLADFINAYNYARRLKTLKGLTPYEALWPVYREIRVDRPGTFASAQSCEDIERIIRKQAGDGALEAFKQFVAQFSATQIDASPIEASDEAIPQRVNDRFERTRSSIRGRPPPRTRDDRFGPPRDEWQPFIWKDTEFSCVGSRV